MLDELIDQTRRQVAQHPAAHAGTVATGIDTDERVMVLVREIQGRQTRVGPCPVMPRIDAQGMALWPVRGDRVLVVTDQFDRPWVACWEPA